MPPLRLPTRLLLWVLLLLLPAGAGCTTAAVATPRPVLITIAGSTAMHPVLQELTDAFTRRYPNVIFTLRGGGSTLGEEQIAAGRIDLAASTLFPPEKTAPGSARLVRVPIGVDGLAVIVHAANPVADLTVEQLRRVYSGDILDWAEVGGDAGEIELVSREDGSGSRRLFEERVMQEEAVSLAAVVMPTSRDVVNYVAKTPLAIGYVSRGLVMNNAASAPSAPGSVATPAPLRVHVVAVGGVVPSLTALRQQEYALIQPLYLISRGQGRDTLRLFIDFVLSPAGQGIVARYHLPVR
ncbi:MAG: phosphate ABC transporter substrate-binding protein [Caldilineaceae bacterium]|nr:phosphate ABC transporter substrate-binding protein [Caldilineaceae bacterium]